MYLPGLCISEWTSIIVTFSLYTELSIQGGHCSPYTYPTAISMIEKGLLPLQVCMTASWQCVMTADQIVVVKCTSKLKRAGQAPVDLFYMYIHCKMLASSPGPTQFCNIAPLKRYSACNIKKLEWPGYKASKMPRASSPGQMFQFYIPGIFSMQQKIGNGD